MLRPPPSKTMTRRGRSATVVALILILLIGGYLGSRLLHGPRRSAEPPPAIPVTIATVQRADFPVYLNGLGTAQPYDTVSLRSRVDGEIVTVAFQQGQMVKEGDLLLQIDPRPYQSALDQATAKQAQDEANLRNAQLILQRYQTLVDRGVVSREQYDTQKATVDQITAQVKGDQAAVENAKTQLDYTTIRSPLTGRAGFRLIDSGNIVHASDTAPIATIVRLEPIAVVFTAPEEQLADINKALATGEVPVTALSSDGTKVLARGKLALVNNQVDQASGTISMKATFENKDHTLWPGLSVATRLLVGTEKQVVVAPNDAIQRGPNGPYTFVINDSNAAELRDLKISNQGTQQTVVAEGLRPGDKVVVAGQYRLQKGAHVAPHETAAAGEADVANAQGAPRQP